MTEVTVAATHPAPSEGFTLADFIKDAKFVLSVFETLAPALALIPGAAPIVGVVEAAAPVANTVVGDLSQL